MGCKQTATKSPSTDAITTSDAPVYVKSALKTSRTNGRGKTEKLSFLKRNNPTLNKSVNFDEKVRVKLRTPTPNLTRHNKTPTAKIVPRQISHDSNDDNDDDDDDQVSSISSQDEDIHNEQIKISTTSPISSLQRNQSNSFWYKNNSIGVIPSPNNIKEKPQQPPIHTISQSIENPNLPIGTRFKVRRKVSNPDLSQPSSPIIPNQSSSTPSYRSSIQSPPLPVQRSLPNTNAVLIEHRAQLPNGNSAPQTAYYAFSRRPVNSTASTEK